MRQGLGMLFVLFCMLVYTLCFNQAMVEYNQLTTSANNIKKLISVDSIQLPSNSFMMDINDQPFEEIIAPQNRRIISSKNLPSSVKEAFIATEDQQFYQHKGFDLGAIVRSFLVDTRNKQIEQGGSTITQQLVRNLYLSTTKTIDRKMKELILAHQLEESLSKEQILDLYVNTIYFQNGVYGIETASRYYLNKSVQDLSLGEIAFLCAIPNNPSFYDPLTHEDHTKKREEWILQKMLDMKYINKSQLQAALATPIKLNIHPTEHLYPDYASYVDQEFTALVSNQEGFTQKLANASGEEKKNLQEDLSKRVQEWLAKGVVIYTSLDPTVQQLTKKAIAEQLPQPQLEGAVAIIDNQTNQIKAIAGGKNVDRYSLNRAFQSFRQPGSAIKPLLVYGPFLDQHPSFMPSTLVNAQNFCKDGYCPENYGGQQYGMVTLETAFKYSLNTPAVRLLDELGIQTAFSYLNKFSFSNLTPEDQRLPSALGGLTYGVTPLEMTNAFTTFAHQGQFTPAHAIRKVTDQEGHVLFQWKDKPIPIWSNETNEKLRYLLSKVVTEGTAAAADFPSEYIGGKTGTTDEAKDLWFIGLTNHYTAGVWVGYDQPTSMSTIEKTHPQLLIWKQIMQQIN